MQPHISDRFPARDARAAETGARDVGFVVDAAYASSSFDRNGISFR